MKKTFYITMVTVLSIEAGNTMNCISYHSIVENEKKQERIQCVDCLNSAELQDSMNANTLRFITANPLDKRKVAEELLPEYKRMFCNSDDEMLILNQLEEEFMIPSFLSLSEDTLSEVAADIACLCEGLREVAVKIQNMYEFIGEYRRSLLWAVVSYKLGCQGAEEAIGRLLVGMGR